MSQSFLRHSRHCGLCTSINKSHQTFGETNRSYGLGTATHSTALNCSALAKRFESLPALISWPSSSFTERRQMRSLISCWGHKVTIQGLRLNRYLVPFFGVHRMCVPYGMWGLKTQQVIHPEKNYCVFVYALDLVWKMLSQPHTFQKQDVNDIAVEK